MCVGYYFSISTAVSFQRGFTEARRTQSPKTVQLKKQLFSQLHRHRTIWKAARLPNTLFGADISIHLFLCSPLFISGKKWHAHCATPSHFRLSLEWPLSLKDLLSFSKVFCFIFTMIEHGSVQLCVACIQKASFAYQCSSHWFTLHLPLTTWIFWTICSA